MLNGFILQGRWGIAFHWLSLIFNKTFVRRLSTKRHQHFFYAYILLEIWDKKEEPSTKDPWERISEKRLYSFHVAAVVCRDFWVNVLPLNICWLESKERCHYSEWNRKSKHNRTHKCKINRSQAVFTNISAHTNVAFLHPERPTAWPRTSSPGRTWWCCWCPVHKRSQMPKKRIKQTLPRFPKGLQDIWCWKRCKSKCNTSKRRWSASSKGFPSSLFSTWATPVTQNKFTHTNPIG